MIFYERRPYEYSINRSMKFEVLENKEKSKKQILPDTKFIRNIFNGLLNDFYKSKKFPKEMRLRQNTNDMKDEIEVPTTNKLNSRLERTQFAANIFTILDQDFMKNVRTEFDDIMKKQFPDVKIFSITKKHARSERSRSEEEQTQIHFYYRINKENDQKFKILDFKPFLEESMTVKTIAYELLPFLYATEKLKIQGDKYIHNKKIHNPFLEVTEEVIGDIITSANTNPSKWYITQGKAIKNEILDKIKVPYYITSGNAGNTGAKLKTLGVELTKQQFEMQILPDNFAKFDILLIKANSITEAKNFENVINLQQLLSMFANSVSVFNTEPKVKYLGLSMKKGKGSQAGKFTTFFNEHLELKSNLRALYADFWQTGKKLKELKNKPRINKIKIFKIEKNRKFLFDNLKNEINMLVKDAENSLPRGVNLEIIQDSGYENFWIENHIDSQDMKYRSMLFIRALLSPQKSPIKHGEAGEFLYTLGQESKNKNKPAILNNFLEMLRVGMAIHGTYNPTYFKVEGDNITIYDVGQIFLNLALGTITIRFTEKSELITVEVPVEINIRKPGKTENDKKTTIGRAQFRCSASGINPELQSFHIEKLSKNLDNIIIEKTQEIINKINNIE